MKTAGAGPSSILLRGVGRVAIQRAGTGLQTPSLPGFLNT